MVHPKGSWVPYKPFPSQKIWANLVGDQSLHKVMFFGSPFWAPKGPPGLPGPRCGVWAPKCVAGAPKMGLGQKYQSCVLKNHAEPTGRCPKRSHMLQVMAPNHFGVGALNFGVNPLPLGQLLGGCLVPFVGGVCCPLRQSCRRQVDSQLYQVGPISNSNPPASHDRPSCPRGMAWLGLAWLGMAWLGWAWHCLAWLGMA